MDEEQLVNKRLLQLLSIAADIQVNCEDRHCLGKDQIRDEYGSNPMFEVRAQAKFRKVAFHLSYNSGLNDLLTLEQLDE